MDIARRGLDDAAMMGGVTSLPAPRRRVGAAVLGILAILGSSVGGAAAGAPRSAAGDLLGAPTAPSAARSNAAPAAELAMSSNAASSDAATSNDAVGPNLAAVTIALAQRATGLNRPLFVTEAPDSSGRLFIVEQTGRILILQNGTILARPFFDIHASVSQGAERGLLGLAFHPSFATNHKLYISYTNLAGTSVVSEYRTLTSNPNVVSAATRRVILTQAQPYANHNGGMIAFGRGGYLFIGFGDGGSAGDPGNRAQSLNTWLGKILRIDINGSTSTHHYRVPSSNPYVGRAGLDEIWQRGVRNPWRFSFDRANGNLWIGDVGQNSWEEVDRAIKTSAGPGKGVNWGWKVMEGSHCYSPSSGCNTSGKAYPLLDYSHSSGRCSVTGGYVYRGSAIPALVGGYVFGDYCSGEIWVTNAAAARPAAKTLLLSTGFPISSFGEDRHGELYVVDYSGRVLQIVAG